MESQYLLLSVFEITCSFLNFLFFFPKSVNQATRICWRMSWSSELLPLSLSKREPCRNFSILWLKILLLLLLQLLLMAEGLVPSCWFGFWFWFVCLRFVLGFVGALGFVFWGFFGEFCLFGFGFCFLFLVFFWLLGFFFSLSPPFYIFPPTRGILFR